MARDALFSRLKTGLEEGIAHERRELELRGTELGIPEPPRAYCPEDIRAVRERLRLSQAGFALLLHVSRKTVQSWEQGLRNPSGAAARLIQFIENPNLLECPSLPGSGTQ